MLSTFCLYTYIGKPPKGAFTHKKENLPKTSFNISNKKYSTFFHYKISSKLNPTKQNFTRNSLGN